MTRQDRPKPQTNTPARECPSIGFLIGTPQDYHQLLPLMEAVPETRRTIILRRGLAMPGAVARLDAMAARLSALGYATVQAVEIGQVPWHSLDALVCASESTANSDHLLNAAFITHARTRDIATFQLQHGIVPRQDFTRPVIWFAEHYLAWGTEVRDLLAPARRTRAVPATAVFRALDAVRYTVTGCPKFDAYATHASTPAPVRATDLFGPWASRFRRTILIATNLHWQQHRSEHGVWPAVRDLVQASPSDLFVLKLHPAEEPPDDLQSVRPPNLVVLDELETLRLGFDSARLVLASDMVICTLSTIALEAALAGRPFLVLNTGNPNRYHGVRPIPPADLPQAVAAAWRRRTRAHAFIERYVDRDTIGSATTRVLNTIARVVRDNARKPQRLAPSRATATLQALDAMATLLVQRDSHAAALELAATEKDRYATSLIDELARKERALLGLTALRESHRN